MDGGFFAHKITTVRVSYYHPYANKQAQRCYEMVVNRHTIGICTQTGIVLYYALHNVCLYM